MHPEEVRRRAKLGLLPGAKPGKNWIFIEDDLAAYVRSHYAVSRQALQVTPRKDEPCHSSNANTWWIDFTTPSGERVRRSAETSSKAEAQELHDRLKAESWRVQKLGEKPKYTWDDAAYKWLWKPSTKKRTIKMWRQLAGSNSISGASIWML